MSVESAAMTPDQIGGGEKWQVFSEEDEWCDAPGIRAYAVAQAEEAQQEEQQPVTAMEAQQATPTKANPPTKEEPLAGEEEPLAGEEEPLAEEQPVPQVGESDSFSQLAVTSEIIGFGALPGRDTGQSGAVVLKAFAGKTIEHIASGANHSMAVVDGMLYSWGSAVYGRLGHGNGLTSKAHVPTPTPVVFLKGRCVVHACCGEAHSMAVLDNGDIYSWGSGMYGCLGHVKDPLQRDSNGEPYLDTPKQIEALKGKQVVHACCGKWHSMAVLDNGDVYSWGSGIYGCLGHGADVEGMLMEMSDGEEVPYLLTPTRIMPLEGKDVVFACCSEAHSMVVTRGGALYTWGSDDCGLLGYNNQHTLQKDANNETYSPTPMLVQGLTGKNVVSVCCGEAHNLAVLDTGDIYSWGSAEHSCLGHAEGVEHMEQGEVGEVYLPYPTQIVALKGKKVVLACCGEAHSMAVLDNGDIYSWGSGMYGCLGHELSEEQRTNLAGVPSVPTPTIVPLGPAGLSGSCERIVSIGGGGNFSIVACAVQSTQMLSIGLVNELLVSTFSALDAEESEMLRAESMPKVIGADTVLASAISTLGANAADETFHAELHAATQAAREEEEHVAKLTAQSEKSFDRFDVHGKGVITKADFEGLWIKYYTKKVGAVSVVQMHEIGLQWCKMDVTGVGEVTRNEFVDVQTRVLRAQHAEAKQARQAVAEKKAAEDSAKEAMSKEVAQKGRNPGIETHGGIHGGRGKDGPLAYFTSLSSLIGVCSGSQTSKAAMRGDDAAKTLQSRWRGFNARKTEDERMETMAEEYDAASSMQAVWRGRMVRCGGAKTAKQLDP
jgi:alpha-tubulin suppressor-like RCC1 family protein